MAYAGSPYFEKKGNFHSGNIAFRDFVPSDEILKSADIAIHHGGQNTTVQCIAAKVPALIFPGLHFERYYNAKKAAGIGCAMNMRNEDFTPERLLLLCKDLIEKKPLYAELEKYSEEIKKLGGSRQAARIILN